jgi:hypothetical protein
MDVPDAPTIGTATAGEASSSITFTAATTGGTPTIFTATSNPGSITATSATSPITVSGLTPATAYTFTVTAGNSAGTSPASSASNSATPTTPIPGALYALGSGTVGSDGTTTTISFIGIPDSYEHLQLRISAAESTTDAYFQAVYNGDTLQTNYPRHRTFGSGSSVGASATINVDGTTRGAVLGSPLYSSTYHYVSIADIFDYNSNTKAKTTRVLGGQDNNGSGIIELHSSVWVKTDPIVRIDVRCNLSGGGSASSTFKAGSIVSLYGVK